ncbi:MAG: hypothetical protein IAG10_18145 [Planctomycetaceae bacterium]|nr:hypothetical protein [Planctomycetaceae bacterium]
MDLLGIAIGFILGLISSWLFWRWQLMIAPHFTISSQIAVRPALHDPSKLVYQIKIVNRSARSIIDMTASLGVGEVAREGLGRKTIHLVKLRPEAPTYIGPATGHYDPWSITCVHYYTSEPDNRVSELLTEERKLVFTVQATDAHSGTTVLKRVLYEAKDIVKGHFEGGAESGSEIRVIQSQPEALNDGSARAEQGLLADAKDGEVEV